MTLTYRSFLTGLLVLLLALGDAQAQETWLGSSHGLLSIEAYSSTVTQLVVGKDGTLYAVGENPLGGPRLFKSTDKGESWTYLTPVNAAISQILIAADGALYVGTFYGGIYTSADKGATWTLVKTGLEKDSVSFLAEDVNGVLYGFCLGFPGTTPEQRIIKSTDKGATWTTAPQIPTEPKLVGNSIIEMNGELYANTIFGLWKSLDQGKTWQLAKQGELTLASLVKAPDGTLYENTYLNTSSAWVGGMMRSTDSGATWSAIGQSLPDKSATMLTVMADGTLYGISGVYGETTRIDQVYKSTDKGSTWTAIGMTGMRKSQIQSLLVTADGTVYIGEYQGGVQRLEIGTNINNGGDADRVFNWAEALHPEIFPRGPVTRIISGYSTRYYPVSDTYLGAKNNHLYVHDGKLLNLIDVGLLGDFLPKAQAAGF
ncbi:MAG: exo-alpha-sialidase [Sulfuricella sp.]|nr:exo-alpha-sialidase [Sulfuricella sp.]